MTVTIERPPAKAATDTVLSPTYTLTAEQLDAFGDEMDAIRQRVIADLGDVDAAYIRKVVKYQRGFEVAGRAMFYLPPLWPLAVASLSVSKILDNMEIGHNVMHGQYDWMGDPGLNSRMFDWDTM
ncbi:MAG: acyl-CoA desaturase, partial [Microthrixaceae bacterium]